MNWIYNGVEFTDDMIPEGAVGFVYEMKVIIDGKLYRYIGKKNFYSNTKVKLGKKELSSDKRKKTYKRVTKLGYHNYFSSNDTIKKAHKEGKKIIREMLMICYTNQELTYQEAKHLFCNEVLEREEFLNSNILGKFYKTK
jgi:hypothetical protein